MKFLQRVILLICLSACSLFIVVYSTATPAWADGGEGGGEGGGNSGGDGDSGDGDSGNSDSGHGDSDNGQSGNTGEGNSSNSNGTTGYQTGFWGFFNKQSAKPKSPVTSAKSGKTPLSVVIRDFKKSGKGRFLDANITKKNRVSYYKVTFIRPNGKVGSILVPVRSKSNGASRRSRTNFNRN